jgi:pyruvate dehydrogenase E2 component (dihydrolipoyllysine-residue acetyltransferase)
LVGHSLGGLVAASLALRDPGRARSLSLVASAGLGEEINGEYLERFISAGSRRELRPALELLFADSGQVTRQLVDDVLKYKRIDGVDTALRSIADQIFGGGQQHVFLGDRLAELKVPLLVLWGAEDQIIPAEHARRVPESADVHILEGSGHAPHMEAPGDVNRLMHLTLDSKEISS